MGTHKLNLCYFICNARPNCKFVCQSLVKLITLHLKTCKANFSSAKFWKQTTKPRLILWNSLKKLERHHSSRQNLGLESIIWIIQNHSKSVRWHIKSYKIFLLFNQGHQWLTWKFSCLDKLNSWYCSAFTSCLLIIITQEKVKLYLGKNCTGKLNSFELGITTIFYLSGNRRNLSD